MGNVDLERLLEPHSKELTSIAEAAIKGQRDKVIDGVASLAVTLATGNPLIGSLVPLARTGIARALGNAANEMLVRELAKMQADEEKHAFLNQIDEIVAVLIGQAVVQLIRVQHNAKDEVLLALGGVREDFQHFRDDFERQIRESGETVRVDEMVVRDGGTGVQVRASTTKRVRLNYQLVAGKGSTGIVLE